MDHKILPTPPFKLAHKFTNLLIRCVSLLVEFVVFQELKIREERLHLVFWDWIVRCNFWMLTLQKKYLFGFLRLEHNINLRIVTTNYGSLKIVVCRGITLREEIEAPIFKRHASLLG